MSCSEKSVLICNHHFNTPVLGTTSGVVRAVRVSVRGDRILLAVPLSRQAGFAHTVVAEFLSHRFSPVFGQSQVVGLTADCIRVPLDRNAPILAAVLEDGGDVPHFVSRFSGQAGAIKLEQHVRQIDHYPAFGFTGVQLVSLQLFQEGTVASDLLTLPFNQLALRVESLILRFDLASHRVATDGTQARTDGRARSRLSFMAADDGSTSCT